MCVLTFLFIVSSLKSYKNPDSSHCTSRCLSPSQTLQRGKFSGEKVCGTCSKSVLSRRAWAPLLLCKKHFCHHKPQGRHSLSLVVSFGESAASNSLLAINCTVMLPPSLNIMLSFMFFILPLHPSIQQRAYCVPCAVQALEVQRWPLTSRALPAELQLTERRGWWGDGH